MKGRLENCKKAQQKKKKKEIENISKKIFEVMWENRQTDIKCIRAAKLESVSKHHIKRNV